MPTTEELRAREAANLVRELVDDYLLVPSERYLRQADMVLDIAGELFPGNQRTALADEIDRARWDAGAKRRRRVLDLMQTEALTSLNAADREEFTREYAEAPAVQGAVAQEADRGGDR